jgi:hypothetical protein
MTSYRMRRALAGALGAVAMFWPMALQAAPATPASEPDAKFQNADDFALELFAPTAPALVTLGMSPRRMADPGAFRDIEIDFANISSDDRYKLGAAIGGTPYWWLHRDTTIGDYRAKTDRVDRILARTEVSAAAAYVHYAPADFYNLGIGIQTQLLDRQDHRLDPQSFECLTKAWDDYRRPANQAADDAVLDYLTSHPDATEEDLTRVRDQALAQAQGTATGFATARDSCRIEAGQRALGRSSLMIGGGVNSRTINTRFDGLRYDGGAVWGAYRQPLVKSGFLSLELFAQYRFDGVLDVPKNASSVLVTGDEFTGGGGLALEQNWWKLDGALSYVDQTYSNVALASDDYAVGVVRGAVKVHRGLWLQASVGDTVGRNFSNDPFFSFNVKFDLDEIFKG